MEPATDPPTDRWHAIRSRQRELITDAVIAAVTGHPQETVTVSTVASIARISRKTFYKYFRSLDEAMAFAAEAALRGIGLPAPETLHGQTGMERFLATIEGMMLSGLAQPELLRFLSHFDFAFRGNLAPEVERSFSLTVEKLYQGVGETFLEGQRDGSIRADLDPVLTVATAGNAALGLVQRIVSFPLDAELEAIARLELEAWGNLLAPVEGGVPSR
jgi:AcrR family transcriptional regulator